MNDTSMRIRRPASGLAPFLALLAASIYWFANRSIDGPAYQQDEIGYLINAAFLSGHVVDGFSSYHAGFSILLAPLFLLLNTPEQVWEGVKVVNALLWSGSLIALAVLLEKYVPEATGRQRLVALVIAAAYPAWSSMAGYAFSQSAFVFFFMLAVLAYARWRSSRPLSIVPHSLLVAYLFWIHPTALGVIVASVAAVGLASWKERRVAALFLHVVLVAILVAAYKLGVQPWMADQMTPPGYQPRVHYPELETVMERLGSYGFWRDWILVMIGQFSYLSIATLGAFIFAMDALWRRVLSDYRDEERALTGEASGVAIFLIASVIGVMMITSTLFASQPAGPGAADEWFYGRYVEGVTLPLLAIGIVAQRRKQLVLGTAVGIAIFGLVLERLVADGTEINLVNIQAFWPKSLMPNGSFDTWFLVGAIIVGLSWLSWTPLWLVAMLSCYMISAHAQYEWHKSIVSGYSRPTSMIEFVRANFQPGACVGFDPVLPGVASLQMEERIRLYSFYLSDYAYRRMAKSDWIRDCDGPLFTYSRAELPIESQVRITGLELGTGLLLLTKGSAPPMNLSRNDLNRGGVLWSFDRQANCDLKACLLSSELKTWSQVGKVVDGALVTTERAGWLFVGPYIPMRSGSYQVSIESEGLFLEGAVIDVTSNLGRTNHAKADFSALPLVGPTQRVLNFELPTEVLDLEVRLKVTELNKIKIHLYEIQPRPAL